MNYRLVHDRAEILVIDDDPNICEMIKDCLEQEHLHCWMAHNAEEVGGLIREKEFDVVISDICMPEKTGLDILQYINHLCPKTKTILMTGHRRSDWAQQALRNGAYDYLEKPLDMNQFHAVVRQALQEQRAEQNQLDPHRLVDRHGTLILDKEGVIQFSSDNFIRLSGRNPVNVLGMHFDDVLYQSSNEVSSLQGDDGHTGSIPPRHFSNVCFEDLVRSSSVPQKVTVTLARNDGKPFDCELEIRAVPLEEAGLIYHVRIIDLSPVDPSDSQKVLHVHDPVGHDQLTGLPNHRAFQDELSRLCYQCRRYGHSLAVMLLDVKNFGDLNATYGYSTGDDLLVDVGKMIRKRVRLADYVARYSSDEFAVIMPETDGRSAMILAERLCETVKKHCFSVGSKEIYLSLCVGIVECQSGFIESQNELLHRANDALKFSASQSEPQVILWGSSLGLDKAYDVDQPDPLSAELSQFDHVDKHLRAAYMEMARSLVAAVEAKDPFTQKHSLNVANYAEFLARYFDLDETEIGIIRCAATLHDVGKIGIPDEILVKPGPLTGEEFELIKQHSIIGADILGKSAFFSSEVPLVRHHHEWYDGRGYPDGLAGEAIPFGARIINVCDAVDCMFNIRSYKQGYNLDKVLSELESNSGTQFDPKLAEAMMGFLADHPEKIQYPG